MKKESNNIGDYPDATLLHPSKYLKSAEVKLAGRPVPLTIARIEPRHEAKTDRGTEFKPVLFFRETQKGVFINKTNTARLVECFGKDPRKWIGCRVVFRVEVVDSFGKKVEAIRVDIAATMKTARSGAASAPAAATHSDESTWSENDEAALADAAADAEVPL